MPPLAAMKPGLGEAVVPSANDMSADSAMASTKTRPRTRDSARRHGTESEPHAFRSPQWAVAQISYGLARILEMCVFDFAAELLQQPAYAPYCMNVTIPFQAAAPPPAGAHRRTSVLRLKQGAVSRA